MTAATRYPLFRCELPPCTGGLAYGKLTDSGSISNIVTTTPFSFSKTSVGWTAGGGVEGHLAGNWTWKVEYLFMTFDEPSGTVTDADPVDQPWQYGQPGLRSYIHGQHHPCWRELQMAIALA